MALKHHITICLVSRSHCSIDELWKERRQVGVHEQTAPIQKAELYVVRVSANQKQASQLIVEFEGESRLSLVYKSREEFVSTFHYTLRNFGCSTING